MNSSTTGNRYYPEEFKEEGPKWLNVAFLAVAIIGAAAFFMLAAFLIGSHVGARHDRQRFPRAADRGVAALKFPRYSWINFKDEAEYRAFLARGKAMQEQIDALVVQLKQKRGNA